MIQKIDEWAIELGEAVLYSLCTVTVGLPETIRKYPVTNALIMMFGCAIFLLRVFR